MKINKSSAVLTTMATVGLLLALGHTASAGDVTGPAGASGTTPAAQGSSVTTDPDQLAQATNPQLSPIEDYFDNWFKRVDQIQAEQPHWMTPIVTVTPRLEEELRYDQFWQDTRVKAKKGAGEATIRNFDGGKGLELIPWYNTEVILGVPPYEERKGTAPGNSIGDWPFLLVKYRLLSANEENGNYILTAFLQGSAPTGTKPFTTGAYAVTPTIAGGAGWGDFDVQATVGHQFLMSNAETVGDTLLYNVALQYHALQVLWPEVEFNGTYWTSGSSNGGKNQVFVTPGIILGRVPIYDRVKFIVGVGYQIAISRDHPSYRNSFILTMRTPF